MCQGAKNHDRVGGFLAAVGGVEKKERSNPKKAVPGKAATERAEAKAAKAADAADAAPAAEEATAE